MNTRYLILGLCGLLTFTLTACEPEADNEEDTAMMEQQKDWALVIHGGAGTISRDMEDERRVQYEEGLETALQAGADVLENGGESLDAIEAVIIALEDDSLFNAGKGAVYTNEERHELDASVMDGSTMEAGAITGVTTVKNPITLARHVMENSRHILFAADGAEAYADETDIERVDNSYFNTQHRYEALQNAMSSGEILRDHDGESRLKDQEGHDLGTVGAAALDQNGNLAAGTSTGGLTNKMYGRVGDVPIIGAGTYAKNGYSAVSVTGAGEELMRYAATHHVTSLMEHAGKSLQDAVDHVLNEQLSPGDGGIIAVDQSGNIVAEFTSEGMYRGSADSEGEFSVAIWD